MAVADEEFLRRSFKPSDVAAPGRLSSTAFNDPGQCPSVDRALLRADPSHTKRNPEDGVAELLTSEVRGITNIEQTGQNGAVYKIDVHERPVEDNPAHAQVEAAPDFAGGSRFKKLKEALSLLASKRPWLINPGL